MPHFHLFAYGTLRRPDRPPGRDLLRDCESVGEGAVQGALYHAGDYPALVLDGTGRVAGRIWRCPADLLLRLDDYEAVGEGLFRRVAMRVGEHPCWVYVAGPRLGRYLTADRRIGPRAGDSATPYL